MTATNGCTISLTPRWNDWHSATARLDDLRDVHWHRPTGAPQPIVHAYISCTDIVSGDLPHVCQPSSAPHHVRVCVLRRHNLDSVYAELMRRADQARRQP